LCDWLRLCLDRFERAEAILGNFHLLLVGATLKESGIDAGQDLRERQAYGMFVGIGVWRECLWGGFAHFTKAESNPAFGELRNDAANRDGDDQAGGAHCQNARLEVVR
jgi:hypothetical protein